MPPPAASWVSATFAPAPTGPRQTARQSASSRRCCASGPTGAYTEAPQSDAANSPAGSIATTTTESTAPSAIARQLLVSTSCLGTTWLGTTASEPGPCNSCVAAAFRAGGAVGGTAPEDALATAGGGGSPAATGPSAPATPVNARITIAGCV